VAGQEAAQVGRLLRAHPVDGVAPATEEHRHGHPCCSGRLDHHLQACPLGGVGQRGGLDGLQAGLGRATAALGESCAHFVADGHDVVAYHAQVHADDAAAAHVHLLVVVDVGPHWTGRCLPRPRPPRVPASPSRLPHMLSNRTRPLTEPAHEPIRVLRGRTGGGTHTSEAQRLPLYNPSPPPEPAGTPMQPGGHGVIKHRCCLHVCPRSWAGRDLGRRRGPRRRRCGRCSGGRDLGRRRGPRHRRCGRCPGGRDLGRRRGPSVGRPAGVWAGVAPLIATKFRRGGALVATGLTGARAWLCLVAMWGPGRGRKLPWTYRMTPRDPPVPFRASPP
jgi:hypothetical protein